MDLAAEREHLGAAALFGAHGGEPIRALQNDLRDVRVRFDVVEDGRLAEQTLDRRERRAGTRLAAVPFDGGHQRRLFAADERARAEADVKVEVETRAEDVLAQKPHLARLLNGDGEALDRDRVLCADVHIALVRADGVPRDRHRFDDGVRVALQNGAVHERAGVALVGVAADVLLFAGRIFGELPLPARGEARAAAAAQAGLGDDVDDVLRGHLGQHFAERLVAVVGDVLLDLFGVDDAAVAQRHAVLFFIEVGIVERLDVAVLADRLLIQKAGDDAALDDVLVDDFVHVLHLHLRVEGAFGVDDHDGAERAQAEAARFGDVHLVFQPLLLDAGDECVINFHRIAGSTARTSADKYVRSEHVTLNSSALNSRR